ncbi:MAG TPA: hypothetical protein VNM14_25165, partial [Planctomycetota bacterium]|nr:hypothetical protein [Planctomycetota bacterium]
MSPRTLALLTILAAAGGAAGCADCCCCTPEKPATLKGDAEAAPRPAPKKETAGKSLFDGKTLGSWKSVEFGGEGA